MEKELTSKLIDAIIEFSGEELDRADFIALAKETNLELTERLIGITRYFQEELNSTDVVEVVKFARKCSVTGKGMNQGYVYNDGAMYFRRESDLIKHIRSLGDKKFNNASDSFILSEAYNLGEYYYTEWDDEDDYQYILVDGELKEIE